MVDKGSALNQILRASRATPAAQDAVGVAALCLLVLVCADMAFIAAHVLTKGGVHAWDLSSDHSYSEIFQYVKTGGLVFVLCALWWRTRDPVYCVWPLLFAYVVCDDAFQIHERGGKLIAAFGYYEPAFALQPKDFGELTVWAAFGVAFLTAITAAYLNSSPAARKASVGIAQLFCLLALFGAVVDVAHSAIPAHGALPSRILRAAVGVIEDGGELLAMSLICWYVVKVLERGGKPPDALFKFRWLRSPAFFRSGHS